MRVVTVGDAVFNRLVCSEGCAIRMLVYLKRSGRIYSRREA